MTPNTQQISWKRGDEAVVDGIKGRITFISNDTGYVRLECGKNWKTKVFINQLQKP